MFSTGRIEVALQRNEVAGAVLGISKKDRGASCGRRRTLLGPDPSARGWRRPRRAHPHLCAGSKQQEQRPWLDEQERRVRQPIFFGEVFSSSESLKPLVWFVWSVKIPRFRFP
jgi:hypothetical protein